MKSEEKKFGKCDECGRIGSLEEIVLAGHNLNARFCESCHHIFKDRPEFSSFIAFQHSRPPEKLAKPVETS
jgi:hypothetical protein